MQKVKEQNIESDLEKVLASFYKQQMILFLESNSNCYEEAIQLAISDKQPYSWRSAWLLSCCIKQNDERIKPFLDKIIHSISSKKDGHQRELLKLISLMELNEEQEGIILNICLDLWEKIGKSPSIRYTALRLALKIAEKHPELKNEISFFLQEQYIETLSPGIKKVVIQLLNEIK